MRNLHWLREMSDQMEQTWIVLLSATVGGIIGTAGTLIGSWITARSEQRKLRLQLVFNAGIENFKQACDMGRQKGGDVMPMDAFLLHMFKLSEFLEQKTIDENNVRAMLKNLKRLTDTVVSFYRQQDKGTS